ncbi:MAG TPA: 16S rRNA (cytosine(1402)-N(4))-methyltransferase RsmH [Dehalococcoidia bacterium]|nr:16S rRNA (cytosine(1402)-N(4))-methyltransferase RsmH [Dehalococcoidia bacterium]
MSERGAVHEPVLLEETIAALAPRPGGRYVDGTVGLGGHAARLLAASAPDGRLLGLDRDADALVLAGERLAPFGERVTLIHDSYAQALPHALAAGLAPCDGFLLDLGASSLQFDTAARGFSFRLDGPLDMRFDRSSGETAAEVVNESDETELANLIWRLGEEPASRRIARAIVRERPIETTGQLARIVGRVAGRPGQRISPATRTFQALRIAVNRELETLSAALERTPELLRSGGRLAVISFHSLEDRIVKQFLQRESRDCICPPGIPACRCGHTQTFRPLGRRPVMPGVAARERNPRSRSARLRAAERI